MVYIKDSNHRRQFKAQFLSILYLIIFEIRLDNHDQESFYILKVNTKRIRTYITNKNVVFVLNIRKM